jgi:hypothetical protein
VSTQAEPHVVFGDRQAQALPEQVWLVGQAWEAGMLHVPALQVPCGERVAFAHDVAGPQAAVV